MGEEAAVERCSYEPEPAFEEVKEETMLDMPPTDSTEFWLIQWIKDKDLLVSDFHAKELSLKLNRDGKLGCLESSTGTSYGVVSFASQQPNATVFLPTGSETKAVGKISRRVCLVRHREHEELKKPNFQSLASSSKKTSKAQKNPKTELIKYAQKRGVEAPLYCVIQEGPPHKPLFKSKVVIAGLTFESPEEYHTQKKAEKAAAELALKSVPDQLLVSSQSYKNTLKKLAEEEHYPLPRYNTMVNTLNTDAPFISTVEFGGDIFKGQPAKIKSQAQINAAKVAFQHFEERRKGSGSSPPVIGGSDMQNAMITSGEPGSSVPKISTVTCQKTDDSDAGSSKKTLAKKGYCSRQGEQTPEHNSKEDESNVGHPDVSGKTCEGPDAPGAESNTATEMPQSTPEMPPKKKLKITKQ